MSDINSFLNNVGFTPITGQSSQDYLTQIEMMTNEIVGDEELGEEVEGQLDDWEAGWGPDNKFFQANSQVNLVPPGYLAGPNKVYTKKSLEDKHSFSDTHVEGLHQEVEEFPKHTGVRSSMVLDNNEGESQMKDTFIPDQFTPAPQKIILESDTYIEGKVYPAGTVIIKEGRATKKDQEKDLRIVYDLGRKAAEAGKPKSNRAPENKQARDMVLKIIQNYSNTADFGKAWDEGWNSGNSSKPLDEALDPEEKERRRKEREQRKIDNEKRRAKMLNYERDIKAKLKAKRDSE